MWSSSPPTPFPPAAVGPSNVWFTSPTLLSADHKPKPAPTRFPHGAASPALSRNSRAAPPGRSGPPPGAGRVRAPPSAKPELLRGQPTRSGVGRLLLFFLLCGVRVGVCAVRLKRLELDHVAGGVGDLRVLHQGRQRLAADPLPH